MQVIFDRFSINPLPGNGPNPLDIFSGNGYD